MSLEDLRDLRARADAAIRDFSARRRREVQAAVEAAVRAHGFGSLNEVLRRPRRSKKAAASVTAPAAEAAYRNPENPAQTWSGRGRRPRWVSDALTAGRTLEDLAA